MPPGGSGGMMPGGGQMIGGGMGGPPGGPPMGGGGQQGGMPQFDLQTLAQRIQQTNPGLPPQAMIAALTRAVPLLNVEGRMQLAQMQAQFKERSLELSRDRLNQQGDIARDRIDLANEKEKRMGEQFKQNQERLISNAKNRFADSAARLDEMTKRRMSVEDRQAAAMELRSVEQETLANHRSIMEQIQAGFLQGADKKAAQDEAVAARDQAMKKIEAWRSKIKGGGAAGSSFDDRFKGEPEQTQTQGPPPETIKQLKEGVATTFGNGQVWTLKGGQPVQVQ